MGETAQMLIDLRDLVNMHGGTRQENAFCVSGSLCCSGRRLCSGLEESLTCDCLLTAQHLISGRDARILVLRALCGDSLT